MKRLSTFLVLVLCCTVFFLFGFAEKEAQKFSEFRGHLYKPEEIVIKFKPNIPSQNIKAIVSKIGGTVILSSDMIRDPIVPNLYLIRVDDRKVPNILNDISKRPEVEYAEPNYIWKAVAMPNDPEFSELWGLHNTGQTDGTSDADIDAPEAWNITKGSRSVIVAVIDTGVDYTHSDLSRNMWKNSKEIPGNGLDDDGNGVVDDVYGINVVGIDPTGPGCGGRPTAGDPMDDVGHGTHVAGTIGAYGNNNLGVTGVNWNISIIAAKFLGADGSGSTVGAILALQYVYELKKKGYNIIATNNSWGGAAYSRALYDAIAAHMAEGILFIAAAGNDSTDNDLSPSYPSSYDLPNIISVAATDHNDALASFSNYGRRSVDIGAPGDYILSTCSASLYDCGTSPSYPYAYFSGTSMATPHVTGLVALIKAKYPTHSWHKIRNLILSSGENKTSLQGKTLTSRRINANRALSCSNYALFEILKPFDNAIELSNRPITLEAINIKCAAPAGAVTVTVGTQTVTLKDDGVFPDRVSNDGIYAGKITISGEGSKTLKFSNGTINRSVVIQVVKNYKYDISSTTHTFTDISTTGTDLALSDDSCKWVNTPFPVKIYGVSCNALYICDNGGLNYEGDGIGYSNDSIPTFSYGNLVVPFWDDLYPGNVYYQTVGTSPTRSFLIQWNNMPHYALGGTNGVTFQIEFKEGDPKIYYRYKDVEFGNPSYDNGASATVGIQKSGLQGNQYSYNTPSLSNNSSLVLTPVAFSAPELSYEPANVEFYRRPVGKAFDQNIYITNTGNSGMTVSALSLSGDPDFTLVSPPSTPFNIGPGITKTIKVRFIPSSVGDKSSSLTITTNAATGTVSITGKGYKEPDIYVTPAQINFGTVSAGSYVDKIIQIKNTGNAPLSVTDIDISSPFSIVGTPPPYTINPGLTKNITVRFAPTSPDSYFSDMFIYSNDPDESAVRVILTGLGN